MSIIKEFKEFAMRGNVIDMAVGVVIGAAFGKIISSLVDGVEIVKPYHVGTPLPAFDVGEERRVGGHQIRSAFGPLLSSTARKWIVI